MPPRLRRRMDALQSYTVPGVRCAARTVDAAALTTLAQACRDDERAPVRLHGARGRADEAARRAAPAGLARPPLVPRRLGPRPRRLAQLPGRPDPRRQPTGARFRPRELPADDALEFVRTGIASMPMRYAVRVRFAVPPEVVTSLVGSWATVEPSEDGCLMTMNADTLDWPVMILAAVDADFEVEEPAELRAPGHPRRRAAGRVVAARLIACPPASDRPTRPRSPRPRSPGAHGCRPEAADQALPRGAGRAGAGELGRGAGAAVRRSPGDRGRPAHARHAARRGRDRRRHLDRARHRRAHLGRGRGGRPGRASGERADLSPHLPLR